jgi:hypothetical protein
VHEAWLTASSADYIRCQQLVAEQRRISRVVVGYGDAGVMADAQAACEGHGVPRGSANFDRCVIAASRTNSPPAGQLDRSLLRPDFRRCAGVLEGRRG